MKSVLISIQPKWCELIASGKKTVEVRKNFPNLKPPFKVYIYETKGKKRWYSQPDPIPYYEGKGKVIGEFVCDKIFDICIEISNPDDLPGYPFPCTGLTDKEILQYLGNGKAGYGWHISQLKIYDEPKPLSDFTIDCNSRGGCDIPYLYAPPCENCGKNKLTRPPQSWCYVEEVKEGG